MIVRHYIECETCGHTHILRIQVGHSPYQEHSFHCSGCGEDIVVGMHCYPETGSVEINEVENAIRCKGISEGTIINLSPEFPIHPDDLHRDLVFPSMEHMHRLAEAQGSLGVKPISFSSIKEARQHALNTPSYPEMWAVVKKGWSLSNRGKEELASKQLQKYPAPNYSDPPRLNYVLFDFCGHFLMPGRYSLFEDAANMVANTSRQYPHEYQKFISYYIENLEKDNLSRYFDVFSEYFKCFNDFSQTLMFSQHNIALPEEFEATSYAFSKTKLFYGNAFEALTSNIIVLACIGNITNGRKFDEFKTMNLAKYQTINKANRANPFDEIEEFTRITKCLDSTLRNASHHGAASLSSNGKKIEYRSGGTGARHTMPYKAYLDLCNEIMLSCCALLSIELAISF